MTEDRLLEAAQQRRRARVRRPARALPARAARPLLPDARLGRIDADDAMQDTTLRAWRALERFEGRSSLRSLAVHDRHQHLPDADPAPPQARAAGRLRSRRPTRSTGPGEPVIETRLDRAVPGHRARGRAGRSRGPLRAAREHRAGVHRRAPAPAGLPARGPDPARGAGLLGQGGRGERWTRPSRRSTARCSAPARRSRSACRTRASRPRCGRSTTTSSSEIVKTYVDAWERNDIDTVVSLLTEDAAIAMPPLASWFGPRDEFATFLRNFPMSAASSGRCGSRPPTGSPPSAPTPGTRTSRPTWPSRSTC